MADITISDDEYPAPEEVSISNFVFDFTNSKPVRGRL
jgi:hypothetical protein